MPSPSPETGQVDLHHELSKTGGSKTIARHFALRPQTPARFPDNGRALSDDVSDIFLGILTNGKVTGDKVGPHNDLLTEFPYLGPPHEIRGK